MNKVCHCIHSLEFVLPGAGDLKHRQDAIHLVNDARHEEQGGGLTNESPVSVTLTNHSPVLAVSANERSGQRPGAECGDCVILRPIVSISQG